MYKETEKNELYVISFVIYTRSYRFAVPIITSNEKQISSTLTYCYFNT